MFAAHSILISLQIHINLNLISSDRIMSSDNNIYKKYTEILILHWVHNIQTK